MSSVVANKFFSVRWVQVLCFGLLFGAFGFAPPEEPALTEIRRVSFASRADGQGIVIRLHAKEPLNAYSEPRFEDENRIEVILFNAKLANSYRSDTPSDPVVDLSVSERNGHLIFHFALDGAIEVETAAYPDHASNDLLVGVKLLEDVRAEQESKLIASADLGKKSADRGKKLTTPNVEKVRTKPVAKTEQSVEKKALDVPKKTPKVEPKPTNKKDAERKKASDNNNAANNGAIIHTDAPKLSSVALTTKEKAELWTLDTIVIDAGHGGHDPGAVANGVKEKDVNLAVALQLGSYLERFLKVNVIYTRTSDEFVELQERGHIANQAGAKLFISIHANSAPYSSRVTGTETYILGLHRSEKAREVMERENEVISLETNPDQYDAFYQNSILQTLALSANLRMSEKLASEIENQFAERARRHSRGVKQAGLIVLWAASMPAVLVELGYLTNRFEAAYLNSKQGQDYLASAIFRAVRDFKHEYEKGLNLSAAK